MYSICSFQEIYCAILDDVKTHAILAPELSMMETLMSERDRAMALSARRPHVVLDCGILRDVPELSSPVLAFDTCKCRLILLGMEKA